MSNPTGAASQTFHSDSAPPLSNPFERRTFDEFRAEFHILIRADRLRMWRLTYPNVGQLDGFPHFGTVMILATDGIEALYHIDMSGQLWQGHLKAFNGAIAKEWVADEDWDFEKRKRRVNVFKRADGSIVIIPQDTQMENYWAKFPKMSKDETDLYARVGQDLTIAEVDDAVEALSRGKERPKKISKKVKTRKQQILEKL